MGGSNKQTSKGYFGLFELIFDKSPKGPETGVWKRLALVGAENLPIYTLDSHTTEVFEDQIYVFCGRVNSEISSKVFRIDVDKLTISEHKIGAATQGALGQRDSHISFMMQQRYAVLWGGVSGVIGGEDTQTLKMPEKDLLTLVDMERMKRVELGEVEQLGKPPSQREGHCAVIHRNGIYIYGGLSVTGEPGGEVKLSPVATKQTVKEVKPVPEDLNSRKARMNKRRGMQEVGPDSGPKLEGSSQNQSLQDAHQNGVMDIEYPEREQQFDHVGQAYFGFRSGGAHNHTDRYDCAKSSSH